MRKSIQKEENKKGKDVKALFQNLGREEKILVIKNAKARLHRSF